MTPPTDPSSLQRIHNFILLSPGHRLHGSTAAFSVADKKFTAEEDETTVESVESFDAGGAFLCPGFTDLFCTIPSPGAEYRETFETAAAAARAGGFTKVLVHSDTGGGTNNETAVQFVRQSSRSGVEWLVAGNITKNQQGETLAELYELQQAGALAYTDGQHSVQSLPLLLKALQYSLPTGRPLIQLPVHGSLGKHGLMNEGVSSTKLGMPGSPAMAEWVKIQTELELLRYAGGRLHYTGVSTARSLELLDSAISEGLVVSYSLSPMHLMYTDEDLRGYDTHFKLFPCLRTDEDRAALRQSALSGNTQAIASHHLPQHSDVKDCEFEYAKPGVTGLQTAFHQVLLAVPGISGERIAELLSFGPRRLLGLPVGFDKGNMDFTLFSIEGNTRFDKQNQFSKSSNHPLLPQQLPGRILGTYGGGLLHLNPQS